MKFRIKLKPVKTGEDPDPEDPGDIPKPKIRRDPKTGTNMGSGTMVNDGACEDVEYWEWLTTFEERVVGNTGDNVVLGVLTGGVSALFGRSQHRERRLTTWKHHWVVNTCKPGTVIREWDTDKETTPWLGVGGSDAWKFHWEDEPGKANDVLKGFNKWANEHVAPGVGYTGTIPLGSRDNSEKPVTDPDKPNPKDNRDTTPSYEPTGRLLNIAISGYGDRSLSGNNLYDIRARSGNWNDYNYEIIPTGTTMTGAEWKSLIKVWWEKAPGQTAFLPDLKSDMLYTVESCVWTADLASKPVDHDNNPLTAELSYGYYLTWLKESRAAQQ